MSEPRQRLCVFCGSSAGARDEYTDAARTLGKELAARDCGLVYGGGSVGLMGEVASAVMAAGGHVTGIIPEGLRQRELDKTDISDIRVVNSMHERKALMAELSDGFIALPGGLGTLEEIFEALTWAQLGIHAKPCGLLNVGGYYERMVEFLDYSVQQGFVKPLHRSMLIVEQQPLVLLQRLADYDPPPVRRWLDTEQG